MPKFLQLVRDPAARFNEPRDVVDDGDLSDDEKLAVLVSWQADLVAMQRALDENMPSDFTEPGETATMLADVNTAICQVRSRS